ncbi:MAG: hypothetical protein RLZZ338_4257 [Cyanobacteriota bacterium]
MIHFEPRLKMNKFKSLDEEIDLLLSFLFSIIQPVLQKCQASRAKKD